MPFLFLNFLFVSTFQSKFRIILFFLNDCYLFVLLSQPNEENLYARMCVIVDQAKWKQVTSRSDFHLLNSTHQSSNQPTNQSIKHLKTELKKSTHRMVKINKCIHLIVHVASGSTGLGLGGRGRRDQNREFSTSQSQSNLYQRDRQKNILFNALLSLAKTHAC